MWDESFSLFPPIHNKCSGFSSFNLVQHATCYGSEGIEKKYHYVYHFSMVLISCGMGNKYTIFLV
jgi:hypothetical protein